MHFVYYVYRTNRFPASLHNVLTFVTFWGRNMTQWLWDSRSSQGWRCFNVCSKSVNRYIITLYFVLCVQRSVLSVQCSVLCSLCSMFCVFGVWVLGFWGYILEICSGVMFCICQRGAGRCVTHRERLVWAAAQLAEYDGQLLKASVTSSAWRLVTLVLCWET